MIDELGLSYKSHIGSDRNLKQLLTFNFGIHPVTMKIDCFMILMLSGKGCSRFLMVHDSWTVNYGLFRIVNIQEKST